MHILEHDQDSQEYPDDDFNPITEEEQPIAGPHYNVYFVKAPTENTTIPLELQEPIVSAAAPKRKYPRFWVLLLITTIIMGLILGMIAAIVFTPTATITILEQSTSITITSKITLQT